MKKQLFEELVESIRQAGEIVRGERAPAREFHVDATMVKDLRNWEQGRREPTGPAKALLYAIRKDPEHVLKALAA